MKIIIIQKVNVEWHYNDVRKTGKMKEILSLIALSLSIVASLLSMFCH